MRGDSAVMKESSLLPSSIALIRILFFIGLADDGRIEEHRLQFEQVCPGLGVPDYDRDFVETFGLSRDHVLRPGVARKVAVAFTFRFAFDHVAFGAESLDLSGGKESSGGLNLGFLAGSERG